jgi:hypothetical protein
MDLVTWGYEFYSILLHVEAHARLHDNIISKAMDGPYEDLKEANPPPCDDLV